MPEMKTYFSLAKSAGSAGDSLNLRIFSEIILRPLFETFRSSMDVLCTVKNGAGDPLVESHFIMVARCPQSGKAAPVVQLEPKTDLEIKNYDRSADLSQV